MFGLSLPVILASCAAIVTAILIGLAVFHHNAVVGEDNKILVNNSVVENNILEKKDALRSIPYTDQLTIKRLLAGTY